MGIVNCIYIFYLQSFSKEVIRILIKMGIFKWMDQNQLLDSRSTIFTDSYYFTLNKKLLILSGLWPYQNRKTSYIIRCFVISCIIISALPQVSLCKFPTSF